MRQVTERPSGEAFENWYRKACRGRDFLLEDWLVYRFIKHYPLPQS